MGLETLDRLKRGEIRAQIINVWRPLRGPVYDTPLAFADYRSVSVESDLRPSELRYRDWTGQTLGVYSSLSQAIIFCLTLKSGVTYTLLFSKFLVYPKNRSILSLKSKLAKSFVCATSFTVIPP